MSTLRHCTECGTPLPADAPGRSCPVCALKGALAVSGGRDQAAVAEQCGDHIGPYRLVEKLGEGGCGVVYLAEQAEPIRRRVALKIIKLGMDTRKVIARFEAERHTLALMDHPNIARVLDAGATDSGRPYFVMELVRGMRITEYCDQNRLSTKERLGLFGQVCHAVQHAHQKGIIHRDLKPSNILIAANGSHHLAKVIDFGIAKATEQQLTSTTLITGFAQFIGTPAYMSPEQAEKSPLGIDTRSDIYSMGVLLYELLTGRLPFDQQEAMQSGWDAMRRLICEREQARPSARLSELAAEDLSEAANLRDSEPSKLINLVRGDLDWIVTKCLEKDRNRRYQTAGALEEDLIRHLNHEPVEAAAPAILYRMGKFTRRHRAGVAMSGTIVLLLVAGVLASTRQAIRATRAESEQSRLLAESQSAHEEAVKQRVRAEVERAGADAQRIEAQRQRAEAEAQRQEAQRQGAEAELQRGKALAALQLAETEKAGAEQARNEANNERMRAEVALEEARTQRDQLEKTLDFMLFDLSNKLLPIGRVDLMRSVTEEVLAHYQSLSADDESENSLARRYAAFMNLGRVLAAQGESARSLDSYQTCLHIAEKLAGSGSEPDHWQGEISACHERLGEFWQSRGDSARALQEFRVSLEIAQRLASRHPDNLTWQRAWYVSLVHLGETCQMRGEVSRPLSCYELAMEIARAAGQNAAEDVFWQRGIGMCQGKTGQLLLQEGSLDQAMESCQKCLDTARQVAAKHAADPGIQLELASAQDIYGDVQMARGLPEKALRYYGEAMNIRRRMVEADPENTERQHAMLQSYFKIGLALSQQSQRSQGLHVIADILKSLGKMPKRHLELAERFFVPEDPSRKPLEAYRGSVELARRLASKDPTNLKWQIDCARSHGLLGDMLMLAGEKASALDEYQAGLQLREQIARTDTNTIASQYELALSHANVAATLGRLSRRDEAVISARKACRILAELTSRWPNNFAFQQSSHVGELKQQMSMIPELRDTLDIIVHQASALATKRAIHEPASLERQEDLAFCCQEMAAFNLAFEDFNEAISHAEEALAVWKYLFEAAPENRTYAEQLVRSHTSLAVLRLINHQGGAAVKTAQEGLELDASCVELKAVLALARLAAGEFEAARALILANRHLKVASGQTFPEAVLNEARRLRAKGLIAVDVEELEAALRVDPDTIR